MRTTGRARAAWSDGNAPIAVPTLAYGRSWSYEGFRCTSRKSGLTCRNKSGHGFTLGKRSQRIF
jgi:hypothetical protein